MTEAINFVIFILVWTVSIPIRATAWTITTIRARLYDPEEDICPACGFRGDRGTGKKTCTIKFVRTETPEKGAIEHTCLRCAAQFYSGVFLPANKWLPPLDEDRAAKVQKIARRAAL